MVKDSESSSMKRKPKHADGPRDAYQGLKAKPESKQTWTPGCQDLPPWDLTFPITRSPRGLLSRKTWEDPHPVSGGP